MITSYYMWAPPLQVQRYWMEWCHTDVSTQGSSLSIAYFEWIVLFEELYHWTANKGGDNMRFIQESGIHEWFHACWLFHWLALCTVLCSCLFKSVFWLSTSTQCDLDILEQHTCMRLVIPCEIMWSPVMSGSVISHDITWSHMVSHVSYTYVAGWAIPKCFSKL